jgi:hypothetical protein
VFNAGEAVKQFNARNIELPMSVLDAVAVLDRLTAARPVQPSPTAVREVTPA